MWKRSEWRLLVGQTPGIDRLRKSVIADSHLCPLIFIHLFFLVCELWVCVCVTRTMESQRLHAVLTASFSVVHYFCEHLSTFDAAQWTNPANKGDGRRYESVRDELNGLHYFFSRTRTTILTHCVPQLLVNVNRMCFNTNKMINDDQSMQKNSTK